MHAERRRGRSRSRVLYWFRTPPGVKVGRAALDEEAIRLIEAHNPDVSFDWTRILKGETGPAPPPRPRPEPQERRARGARGRDDRPGAAPRPSRPASKLAAASDGRAPAESRGPTPSGHAMPPEPAGAQPVDPAGAQAGDAPAPDAGEAPEPGELPEATAAGARLGSEGLSRLRARHAEILARISEKVTDPARADELKSQAERLNPDTWVTGDEVAAGLEQYETVYESLRSVVGRRRARKNSSPSV